MSVRRFLNFFILLCAVAGCGQEPAGIRRVLEGKSPLVFVGAHPDDELVVAPLILRFRPECRIVLFTRGEGGECYLEDGCGEDLGSVREKEAKKAAEILGCSLEVGSFPNSPTSHLPVEERIAEWEVLGAEEWLEERIFPGEVLISFDPSSGYTFHSEHRAAGFIAGVAAKKVNLNLYHILNPLRGELLHMSGEEVEILDCSGTYHLLLDVWNAYRSQHDPFLSAAMSVEEIWERVYLRKFW